MGLYDPNAAEPSGSDNPTALVAMLLGNLLPLVAPMLGNLMLLRP